MIMGEWANDSFYIYLIKMNLEWASKWMHKWSFLLKYFYIANLYQECLGVSFTLIFMLSFDIQIITFTLVANNLKGWKQTGLFKENTKALLEQPSWSLTDSSFIPELVADTMRSC